MRRKKKLKGKERCERYHDDYIHQGADGNIWCTKCDRILYTPREFEEYLING